MKIDLNSFISRDFVFIEIINEKNKCADSKKVKYKIKKQDLEFKKIVNRLKLKLAIMSL